MNFINQLSKNSNETTTLNGALTNVSSGNALLDFFGIAGATRKNIALGLDLFKKALVEDKIGAIRLLFYFRDVRGGQGERELFRDGLKLLAEFYPDEFKIVAEKVAEYGRWDDLFVAFPLNNGLVGEIIKEQLAKDYLAEAPSLIAKWLPSENTSSISQRTLARAIIKHLGTTPKEYRKMLTMLRAKIKIVENNLRTKEYASIDYSKLPSQAGMKYTKAFYRNDEERYKSFIGKVAKGEAKINTATLYPYQLYDKARNEYTPAIDEMWKNLPDYTQGKNAIVVADVSGSMSGQPMSVSVSLALYFAERNKGQFNGYFISFSGKPTLQKVKGKNLQEKMWNIEKTEWEMNTNLQAVFDLILRSAVESKASVDEMPSTIYIVSDMEFDSACGRNKTNFQAIEDAYALYGYTRPTLVFWNVDAKQKQVPVMKDDRNVSLVSGYSPSAFKLAVENMSPLDTMNEVINSERYKTVI